MSLTNRTRPVVMQFTRLVNTWKAYDRLGHNVEGEHLTAGEMQTIKVVAEFPELNTTELADELGVTKGAISQAITKLVERNLLVRYRESDDERNTFTRLTKKGTRIYEKHTKMYEKDIRAFDALLKEADPGQVDFMLEFVSKVEDFFRQQLTEPNR